jgi:hypothetical protein
MPPVAGYALGMREIEKSAEKDRGSRVCRAAGRVDGAATGRGRPRYFLACAVDVSAAAIVA